MLDDMPKAMREDVRFVAMGDDTQFCSSKQSYDWICQNLNKYFVPKEKKEDPRNMYKPHGFGIVADCVTDFGGTLDFCSKFGICVSGEIYLGR